ncbi:MAG: hypothetical protein JST59_00155 [Actinobacteria bacterium]|nr:hypothetical protein [Actinomycetota bacterium]
MQSRLHQPLNLSTFGSSTVNSPKSYSKPPISRSFSTKGFEAGPSEIDSVLERERKAMKENQEKADTAL